MTSTKWLHIVRHGKSDWDYDNIRDIDRPLKERGIHAAYEMSARLKVKFPVPDLIKTSPATRALSTAIIFARVLNFPTKNIQIIENIYESFEKELLEIIKQTDPSVMSLMIFGHNPTFTDLANLFHPSYIENIPTCGVVSFAFETDNWASISKANVKTHEFDYPKSK